MKDLDKEIDSMYNDKDGWAITSLQKPETIALFQFLIPILILDRPHWVYKKQFVTIIRGLKERAINWAELLSIDLFNRPSPRV